MGYERNCRLNPGPGQEVVRVVVAVDVVADTNRPYCNLDYVLLALDAIEDAASVSFVEAYPVEPDPDEEGDRERNGDNL